jgi:hypothetical protein
MLQFFTKQLLLYMQISFVHWLLSGASSGLSFDADSCYSLCWQLISELLGFPRPWDCQTSDGFFVLYSNLWYWRWTGFLFDQGKEAKSITRKARHIWLFSGAACSGVTNVHTIAASSANHLCLLHFLHSHLFSPVHYPSLPSIYHSHSPVFSIFTSCTPALSTTKVSLRNLVPGCLHGSWCPDKQFVPIFANQEKPRISWH